MLVYITCIVKHYLESYLAIEPRFIANLVA